MWPHNPAAPAARAPNPAPQPCSPTLQQSCTNPVSGPHLQTSEAERIGVDQVAKILPTGAASGTNQRAFSGCLPRCRCWLLRCPRRCCPRLLHKAAALLLLQV